MSRVAGFLWRNLRPSRVFSVEHVRRGAHVATAALARAVFRATHASAEFHFSPEVSIVVGGIRLAYEPERMGNVLSMDVRGAWEPNDLRLMLSRLREGGTFYDVGANIGWFSLNVGVWCPRTNIVCFEPHAETLQRNLALNNLDAVRVFAVALGDRDGFVGMTKQHKAANYVVEGGPAEVCAALRTLDGLKNKEGIPDPTVVKIDVEGYELRVLRGAVQTIERSRPMILCEITGLESRYGHGRQDLVDFFYERGYRMAVIDGALRVHPLAREHALGASRPAGICKNSVFVPDGFDQ